MPSRVAVFAVFLTSCLVSLVWTTFSSFLRVFSGFWLLSVTVAFGLVSAGAVAAGGWAAASGVAAGSWARVPSGQASKATVKPAAMALRKSVKREWTGKEEES